MSSHRRRTRVVIPAVAPAFGGVGGTTFGGTVRPASRTRLALTAGTASPGPIAGNPATSGSSAAAPGRLRGNPRPSTPRNGRNTLLPATLVGLLLGLIVAAGGIALVGKQQERYSATASLLVLPDQIASPEAAASLYDSLSSGQVVESYRAVMSSSGFDTATLDSLGLSPRQRARVTPDVHVVPSTALIDASVTADNPEVAERVADALAARATSELSRTFSPYRITTVSGAAGTAKKSGPNSRTLIAVVVLLALVVAVLAQQAVLFVASSRQRAAARRRDSSAVDSGSAPDDAAVGDR